LKYAGFVPFFLRGTSAWQAARQKKITFLLVIQKIIRTFAAALRNRWREK
jgi:hypothetical protein